MSIRNCETKRSTKIAPFMPSPSVTTNARLSPGKNIHNIGATEPIRKESQTFGQWQRVPEDCDASGKGDFRTKSMKLATKRSVTRISQLATSVSGCNNNCSKNVQNKKLNKVVLGVKKIKTPPARRQQPTSSTMLSSNANKCLENDTKVAETQKPDTVPTSREIVSISDKHLHERNYKDKITRREFNHNRPKSARPESRLLCASGSLHDDGSSFEPRPPTSLGRRTSLGNNNRSNSNNHNYTRDVWPRNEELIIDNAISYVSNNVHVSKSSDRNKREDKQGKHARDSHRSVTSQWTTNNTTGATAIAANDSRLPMSEVEKERLWKARTLLDLNSGVDDINIYLDIDPVWYFMADDSYTPDAGLKTTSLSRDAINIIGNTKSALRSKPPICFHSNNQNKRTNTAETHDSYHRNRVAVLQSSNIEHYRGNPYRGHENIQVGDTSITMDAISSRKPATRSHSDPAPIKCAANGKVTSPKVTVSNYRQTPMDHFSAAGGVFRPDQGRYPDRHDDAVLRKPRKLHSITNPIFRHP